MKRSIFSTFFMWSMGLMMLLVSVPAVAQLKQGDTITVSYTTGGKTYYVARNGTTSSLMVVQGTPTKDCLWVLATMKGQPSTTGKENAAIVTAENLSAKDAGATNRFFYLPTTSRGIPSLVAQASASAVYTNKSRQALNNYIEANVYVKGSRSNYYLCYNNSWQANTNTKQTYRIQKWSSVTENVVHPTFLPTSKIFDYAETGAAADLQQIDVTCKVVKRTAQYYYNVSNLDQRIVIQAPQESDADPGSVHFAWRNLGETQMSFTDPQYNPATKEYEFKVKPNGPSPFTTDTTGGKKLIDIENYIVCTATFEGKPATSEMHCIRRKYYKHTPPKLEFSVTHPTYRFEQTGTPEQRTLTLTPELWLQDLTEWVNTDGIVEHSVVNPIVYKEEGRTESVDRYRVKYPDIGLDVDIVNNVDWIHLQELRPLGIPMIADDNNGESERSATILIHVVYKHFKTNPDGNFLAIPGREYWDDEDPEKYQIEYRDEFTRQVTLYQNGAMSGAPIKFTHRGELDANGQQKVHTNKKILYYVPGDRAGMGDEYGSEVELRPAEMAFFAYRRWYNYDNSNGIQNSNTEANNTIWANAPHITNGRTSYNYTPINTDETFSRGVFAIARTGSTCSGYRILYSDMTDAAPVIRGYKTATGGKNNDGVHTIACDLSAFTDYYTHPESGNTIDSLVEPTLSYRMLFELHPANEIANKLAALPAGKYLEEYEYTAPTGVDVHLTTSQRFRSYRYHKSELGYYYWNNGSLVQIQGNNTTITWQQKIENGGAITINSPSYSPNTDNLIVSSRTEQTVVYTLTINAGGANRRIAKFTVHYKKPTEVGPSAVALLTGQEIAERYKVLEKVDWDDLPGKSTANNVIASHHLDWEDATFGYAYQVEKTQVGSNRPTNKDLCYYGEYLLLNNWNSSNYGWMDKNIVNHSGKGNGFMLFADGTMEPSMVASIRTDAQICSGQQMYCSAWVANACPAGYGSGANPIFRFNVQGRNADNEEWEDVEVFFAGELPKGSGWRQIKFQVTSHESYSQTRVCVYNFATTNSGNDFFLDDITLFATPLPISAYQAASACSGTDVVVVVKVDYQNIADDLLNKDVYYQGWVRTKIGGDSVTVPIPNLETYKGFYQWYEDGSYTNRSRDEVMHPDKVAAGTAIQDMGLLHIPSKSFDPENDAYASQHIALSAQEYIERLQVEDERDAHERAGRAGVFFVKGQDGKWAMYLAHLLEAHDGGHYEVHFAEDSDDLSSPLCAMSVKLPIYKKTKLSWNNDSDPTSAPQTNVCPNVEGEIKVTVTNTHIADNNDSQGSLQTTFGKADWLIGIAADTIYGRAYAANATPQIYYGKPKNNKEIRATRADSLQFWKDSADVLFEKYYGYSRHEVQTAFIYDMRRMPYVNNPNDNYDVTNYQLLDSMAFLNPRDYTIVKDLCKRGLVDLNISSRTVMLSPGDSLFLWVFPIVGSATLNGKDLEVCNEPQWVDFRTSKLRDQVDPQVFNPSPIPNEKKTPMQRLTVPSVRVTASKANEVFGVPIMDLQNAVLGWDSLRVIETNDPNLKERVDAYRTAYNNWATRGAAYPDPATFSMRYYADKVYQGTNGEKVYTEGTTPNPAYHSNTKCGTSGTHTWRYYQPGDTMFFRPINSAYVEYLQDRREKSSGAQVDGVYSPYSNSDADWIKKQVAEGSGLQPGFQHVNTPNDTMRANYTYKMTTKLITNAFQGELNDNDKTDAGCNYATTNFDVIVVPELLIWRPTVSNEWGDDANWRGIVNGREMEWGFAPLKTSSVIIPALDNELLYPVVTGDTLYPMSAWYEPASCDNIYMEAGAHILGQEKLSYNKAYVDMPIEHAHWQAKASPMRKMYSGDFFVPHNPNDQSGATLENVVYTTTDNQVTSLLAGHTGIQENNGTLFTPNTFHGTRSSSAPYAFWVNYYNREVMSYQNSTTDANEITIHTASAAFAPSNAVNNTIEAGQGVVVLGYGPWDEGTKQTIPLRLPKSDESYRYFLYGELSDDAAQLTPRTDPEDPFHKFAWKSDDGHPERMTVTLTQGSDSKQFLMGNPTMAYIDLQKFMNANSNVLTGTFGYMYNEKWVEVSKDILDISGHRFLAPMEAIMVQIKGETPLSSINVVFVDSMMTLDDMRYVENAPARAPEAPASAPRRAQAAPAAPLQLMTITAFTDDMEAIAYLGKKTDALNGYRAGEDAHFISSGVEDGTENDYSTLTTPLNIYTVSDSTALMVDLRPGISLVPLHFLTHADYRTDSVNLICNMNMDWNTPCYLIDSVAGTREPIMNGYVMKIELPLNHQSRYYIEGPDPYIQDAPQNPGVTTGVETVKPAEEDLTKYPVEKLMINGHLYIRRGPALFHVTGNRIR